MAAATPRHLPDPVQQIGQSAIGATAPAPGAGRVARADPARSRPVPCGSGLEPPVLAVRGTNPTAVVHADRDRDRPPRAERRAYVERPAPSSHRPPTPRPPLRRRSWLAHPAEYRCGRHPSRRRRRDREPVGHADHDHGTPLPDYPVVLESAVRRAGRRSRGPPPTRPVPRPRSPHADQQRGSAGTTTTTSTAPLAGTVVPDLSPTAAVTERRRGLGDHGGRPPRRPGELSAGGVTAPLESHRHPRRQWVGLVRRRHSQSLVGVRRPLAPPPLHTGARARVVVVPPAVASSTCRPRAIACTFCGSLDRVRHGAGRRRLRPGWTRGGPADSRTPWLVASAPRRRTLPHRRHHHPGRPATLRYRCASAWGRTLVRGGSRWCPCSAPRRGRHHRRDAMVATGVGGHTATRWCSTT